MDIPPLHGTDLPDLGTIAATAMDRDECVGTLR